MTKPERFGEQQGKFGRFGKGNFIRELPAVIPVTYADFTGGYDSSRGREGDPKASPNTTDFEVTRKGRLRRYPGTQAPAALAGHNPYQAIQQTNLDGLVEVIYFDPPFVGIETNGVLTWTDLNLSDIRPYASTQFGETIFFGNGAGPVYSREPNSAPVQEPGYFQARSYATFAARVYGLGAIIDGAFEPMGVRWTGASNDPRDVNGDGAGSELLISDAANGDYGIAVREMGLDFVAFICRKSIWIGRRTGDPFRPADLQPRLKGNGGLSDRTAVSYPGGVAYLSDSGVRSFDGNNSTLISSQINGELLSIDLDRLREYKLTYDPLRNRLLLNTPVCMWVFDIEYNRWYRSSIIASDIVYPIAQEDGQTWAQLQAAAVEWNSFNRTSWGELVPRAVGQADLRYLKYNGVVDSQIAIEDTTSMQQFDIDMLPQWEVMRKDGPQFNSLISVRAVLAEYVGEGSLRIYLPDINGNMLPVLVQDVATSAVLRDAYIPLINTGRGSSLMVELADGFMEISKLQQINDVRSTKYDIPPFVPREYRTDFNV